MSRPGTVLRLGLVFGVVCLAVAAAGAPAAATGWDGPVGDVDDPSALIGGAAGDVGENPIAEDVRENPVAGSRDRVSSVRPPERGPIGGHDRVAAPVGTAATAELDGGFDRTVIDVTVRADGDARWVLRYERALDDDDAVDEFEAFAAEFREEETELYEGFRDDARAIADDGSATTDREMAAESFARDAYVRSNLNNDIGVVELEFTWVGFAELDGDRIVVGDVFEGGFYIAADQELVVRPGDGLAFESVDPEGTRSDPESLEASSSVTWTGERQFTDRRPRAVFQPRSAVDETPTPNATPTASPASGNASDVDGSSDGSDGSAAEEDGSARGLIPWVLAIVLFVGAVAWYQNDARRTVSAYRNGIGSGTRPGGDSGGRTDAAPAGTADEPATEPAVPGERFQSDEDRVVALLRENGCRMKQSLVVEETEWSKSKVSVLLSEMEEEGTISKLRIGRENVVSLDGHEPDAADSPLDDE